MVYRLIPFEIVFSFEPIHFHQICVKGHIQYLSINRWKWMIGCIFHLFSVWWQKLLHHQFLFQEAEGLFFKRQLCNRKWLIQRKHFLQQKGCMYHDKKAWWRDIFMIQLQSFISQDCDFPWDASKSLLFPAPNSKFLSLTYDLHLLTCISVLIGIRLANKGCWKSAFI